MQCALFSGTFMVLADRVSVVVSKYHRSGLANSYKHPVIFTKAAVKDDTFMQWTALPVVIWLVLDEGMFPHSHQCLILHF